MLWFNAFRLFYDCTEGNVMSFNIKLTVPSESIPAIIGLNGSKVKDTQVKSCTTINISQQKDNLHLISITGETEQKCNLARRILLHAVKHYFASLKTESPDNTIPGRAEALLDIHTFYTEILSRKA